MRSKRKEVNKYSHKQFDDLRESKSELQLQRNAGIKPFQLTKLRLAHNHINDSLHKNELLHRRTGLNHFFNDLNKVSLDLIIKQKLIVDAQFNQKLESERKNMIYLDVDQKEYKQGSPHQSSKDQHSLQSKSEKGQRIQDQGKKPFEPKGSFSVFSAQNQELEQQGVAEQQQQSDIEALLKQHLLGQSMAIEGAVQPILRSDSEKFNDNMEQILKMEIKLLKQKTQPPFSFTSAKWRSKSQSLQIDKWKQRYSREAPTLIKQIQKQILTERQKRSELRNQVVTQQKNPIHSQDKQKVSLPPLQKIKQADQPHSIVKLITKKHLTDPKPHLRIENQPQIKTHRSLQLMSERHSEARSRRPQEGLEEKVEIIIKKMYESELQKYQETAVSGAENPQSAEPENSDPAESKKRKKSKFPEIQITTFTSTRELEIQKKKDKLDQIQKLAKQWRYVAPKQACIKNIMEEIPERWEYGESRESSREEVDNYLQVKQQERRENQKVKSEQVETQIEAVRAKEGLPFRESYLTND